MITIELNLREDWSTLQAAGRKLCQLQFDESADIVNHSVEEPTYSSEIVPISLADVRVQSNVKL